MSGDDHGHTDEARDPYLDALVVIEGRAKLNAIAARALGRPWHPCAARRGPPGTPPPTPRGRSAAKR